MFNLCFAGSPYNLNGRMVKTLRNVWLLIWAAICTSYHAMFSRWCHMSLKDKYLNQPFPFKARSRGYRQVWANHGVSTTANFPQSLEVQPMQRIASYHGTCEDNCWWSYSVFIGFLLKSNISAPANLLSENDKYVKAQLAVTEISTSEFQFLQEGAQDECR